VLQTASINAYRVAIATGVVIAITGALVAFVGIRNSTLSSLSGELSSE
jgi:hypothetical protein